MKSLKKLLAVVLAAATVMAVATACSNNEPSSSADAEGSSGVALTKVLKVGASPAPHAEILEFVKPILAQQGIDLQIQEFTDYIIPNDALEAGELDANFFQHKPYMDDFNAKKGTHLFAAAAIHFEPLGVYPGKSSDLKDVKDGAKIAVPSDTTNEARALMLLEKEGLFALNPNAGLTATKVDIVSNPKNIEIVEMAAEQLARSLEDVDFAVINGNYALEAKITDKVIVTEDPESQLAKDYTNILAIKDGDQEREEIKALVSALTSDECREFITNTYGVAAIAEF